jgi:hypothetical protein
MNHKHGWRLEKQLGPDSILIAAGFESIDEVIAAASRLADTTNLVGVDQNEKRMAIQLFKHETEWPG